MNLPPTLTLPQHLAIIMDGNGRWAAAQGLSRIEGHRMGFNRAREVVITANELGIKYVTLFAFSTENWKRPVSEITGLLRLLEEGLATLARDFQHHNIVLRHLGNLTNLPLPLRGRIEELIAKCESNNGTIASFAFDYGSRTEILNAVHKIQHQQSFDPQLLDEALFSRYLYDSSLPEVDLMIRTSGERRLSNFLLWQSAFAELYFTDCMWPDFDRTELVNALMDYAGRKQPEDGFESDYF